MSEFVSVAVNKMRVTVSRAFAEAKGLDVIDEPATDRRGRPLSASRLDGRRRKPKTTVKKAAAKKAAAKPPTNGGVAAGAPEEGTV